MSSPSTPVYILASDITLNAREVLLTSVSLADNYQAEPAETVAFLSKEVVPISTNDVSIDSEGRVVITNASFRATLREKLDRPKTLMGRGKANELCGFRCQIK
jgi:hypothetical protein